MSAGLQPRVRGLLRAALVACGLAVIAVGVTQLRTADWPIYLAYVLISIVVALPMVEVLPRLRLPIPGMAVTIGFLYIGGLPIVALRNLLPVAMALLRRLVPAAWRERIPQLRDERAGSPRAEFLTASLAFDRPFDVGVAAEAAMFAVGLGARWWVAAWIAPGGAPIRDPGAIALGELCGYATWSALSVLPLYPDRRLFPGSASEGRRAALTDIGLIVVLVLTPWVFLINYGFLIDGLDAAAAFAVAAVAVQAVLQRLNERRLLLEEQNRRLEALNRELEHRERLSAIGKMSSVVSHQILQQLGVIGIYADLLRNAEAEAEAGSGEALARVREHGSAIEGALGDVNRVLTDLLVFSKDLRLNLYESPLARVIEECAEECRADATARGVTIRTACPDELHAMIDKLKIKQALGNVLRNALEVSPTGSEVVVWAAARDDQIEIAVADAGPGIPGPAREAVFTPFYTTKEHGTGLGLAIAREFTEAHGGRLWVEPGASGRGATFLFRLPRAAGAAQAEPDGAG